MTIILKKTVISNEISKWSKWIISLIFKNEIKLI